jgi:hypothetical protein
MHLAGIVAVERTAVVNFVRLRLKWVALMLNGEHLCGVMHGAITVVVVADRAIELMIARMRSNASLRAQ